MDANKDQDQETVGVDSEPHRCRNCGEEVSQLYCTWCGQSSKEIRVSFKTLLFDFLDDYFSFDSKLFRSVVPLFSKPGFLTRSFLDGKRVRYIAPLRLYLVSSVFFFLTLALVSGTDDNTVAANNDFAAEPQAAGNGELGEEDPVVEAKMESGATFTDARFDNNNAIGRYINERLDAQDRKIRAIGIDAFMRELVREFLSFLPKALFVLLPLFALLLKCCYLRSEPLYIDHLIFAFHYNAFLYLFTSLLLILGSQNDLLLAISILCGLVTYPTYLLVSMKRVYAQRWHWTLLKFFIVIAVYAISLALLVPLLFMFTAIFFV